MKWVAKGIYKGRISFYIFSSHVVGYFWGERKRGCKYVWEGVNEAILFPSLCSCGHIFHNTHLGLHKLHVQWSDVPGLLTIQTTTCSCNTFFSQFYKPAFILGCTSICRLRALTSSASSITTTTTTFFTIFSPFAFKGRRCYCNMDDRVTKKEQVEVLWCGGKRNACIYLRGDTYYMHPDTCYCMYIGEHSCVAPHPAAEFQMVMYSGYARLPSDYLLPQ